VKLSSQKFSVEQFQDQKDWISKLFAPLNNFISQVYTGFSNQLSVSDNLFMEFKSYTFVYETTNLPLRLKTKFNKYPEMVLIGKCEDSSGGAPSVAPLITWAYEENNLIINSISGLTASSKYTIKFLIIYE